jgi:nucleotidyltransferase/DNA polymerase involved in DNA repair
MNSVEKVVLHFDMDCFYCQVEARRLGVPMSTALVVDQWGMLLSVNYPAKGMGISRKTPAKDAAAMGAIVAHVRVIDIESGEKFDDVNSAYRDRALYKACLDRYREASEEVMVVMKQALPPGAVFERASIDECYVEVSWDELFDLFPDLSDVSRLGWESGGGYDIRIQADACLARGALLGERIRSEVLSVTRFTVSCGVSVTRQVAKLSCAMNKPNKLTVVASSRTSEFMRTVPLKEIRGLGPRAMETLQARVPWVTGSTPCGDVWEVNLGGDDFARWMYDALRGLNDDQVKETSLTASSVQSSKQFRPSLPLAQTEGMLRSLSADMINRLEGRKAKTLVVTMQVGDVVRTRQDKFPSSSDHIDSLVKELAMKTGLLDDITVSGFDRLAVTAKDVDTSEAGKESSGAKKEVADYLASSRLHFMGTWKTRYLQYIGEVEDNGDWGEGAISDSVEQELKQISDRIFKPEGEESQPRYLLVDMDCFFCSVAMSLRDISPESRPCAVASGLGPTSEICSANYAARKYGVTASSFVSSAKDKCPSIEIFAIDTPTLNRCEVIWKKVIHALVVLGGGSFCRVQGKSCDEAILDLSEAGISVSDRSAFDLGKRLQETIMQECKVACSVGIAPSRILAKLATSKAKPKGVKVIGTVREGIDLVAGDKVKSLPGVGYSTQAKLAEVGIETVGDLIRDKDKLPSLLGAGIAKKLIATAQGQDLEEEISQIPSTVSAEKNFGLRNLTLQQASELLEALCETASQRCPPKVVVEKAVLKLKLAGDDWVESAKKGGIGEAYDWSRTMDVKQGSPIIEILNPILKEIETTRIRGIGVSLKIKSTGNPEQDKKRKANDITLDKWMAGESIAILNKPVEFPKQKISENFEEGITEPCIVCGTQVLVGHLTKHFIMHLNDASDVQLCPCPICFEPIELTDTVHFSSHFSLPT